MIRPTNLDGQIRSEQEIVIDDGSFVGAILTRCILIYRGGGLPNFERVQIIDCQWNFTDAAARSLGMLSIIRLGWTESADELLALAQRRITTRASN